MIWKHPWLPGTRTVFMSTLSAVILIKLQSSLRMGLVGIETLRLYPDRAVSMSLSAALQRIRMITLRLEKGIWSMHCKIWPNILYIYTLRRRMFWLRSRILKRMRARRSTDGSLTHCFRIRSWSSRPSLRVDSPWMRIRWGNSGIRWPLCRSRWINPSEKCRRTPSINW